MSENALEQELERLLAKDPDAVAGAQAEELGKLGKPERIILFGAGGLGRSTAGILRSLTSLPLFFCDNKPQPESLDGIPFIEPQKAFADYRDTALFVLTVFNNSHLRAQLEAEGCRYIVSFPTLYRAYAADFLPYFGLGSPRALLCEKDAVRRAFALWADEESRLEYVRLIAWQLQESYGNLARGRPAAETYFPFDLMEPSVHERLVDCGAFDGDGIAIFRTLWQDRWDAIAAFEPDARNRRQLLLNIGNLPPALQSKITVYPYAVGACEKQVNFAAQGDVTSGAAAQGETAVSCLPLDGILADFNPTFIKMDIEGAEPDALAGASMLLRKNAPILAICLYHDLAHLWQIPLQIHAINPSYRLYLRRYAEDCWETVCYAIPADRVLT